MFGFPESLTSESEHPGWGLLPRAVHATLAHNAAQAQQGVHSVLLLSAVEFYAFMGRGGSSGGLVDHTLALEIDR